MQAENRVSPRAVRIWLIVILVMVALMVVIGGTTRLTRSGLSIVDWRPVTGTLPPMNAAEWERAFALYRATPEFQKKNRHFDLADFKTIFFWEYFHRLWGRLIGLAVFFPGLILLLRGRFRTGGFDTEFLRVWSFLFIFGGLQGVLGWYMVKSGLVNEPRVSHYRLAAHLALALFLEAYILWKILAIGARERGETGAGGERPQTSSGGTANAGTLKGPLIAFGVLLCLQILFGAFTAGLHAGYIHNTFPTMSGDWIPDGLSVLKPWYRNLLEGLVTIQFTHRMLGWLVLFGAILLAFFARRGAPDAPRLRLGCDLVAGAAVFQFLLGVATILTGVPVWLGVLHQAGALLLFNVYVFALYAGLNDNSHN